MKLTSEARIISNAARRSISKRTSHATSNLAFTIVRAFVASFSWSLSWVISVTSASFLTKAAR
jgi:hypothetical protein